MNDLHLPVRTRVTAWIKVLKWPGSTASLSVFGGALWVACVSSAHASLFRHLTATDAPSITKNASNVVTTWADHYCPSFLADPIHDTLEQGLTAIQLRLYSMDSGDGDTDLDLVAARSLVQQCHLEMRQSVWNLRSQSSDNFNLAEALERTARSLVLGTSIEVDLEQPKFTARLPLLVEDNLLRIGQEALGNAVRHAHPTRLTIQLTATPNHASLVITDNGRGMLESPRKPGHFGLAGMEERTVRIGGSLAISSAPDTGTTVRVDVPLPTQVTHS